ncbi:ribonuclease HIII [bacterium]|nr:ribonuclease HIII [bacterium]
MNTYTIKITALQADKIKKILTEHNAIFDVVQYSVWRAKTAECQAIYYTSGKFLMQGKNVDNIANEINDFLGIKSTNNAETSVEIKEDKYIGTDESGKGDFFGPLVIAGVQVDNNCKQKFIDLGIKDSKKLDDKKILQFANIIKANAVHSVVVITPIKYNELYDNFKNLNKLLAWGHARAIENILEKSPCNCALADKFGDESLIQNALMQKGKNITLKQMVRAEADIAVAAASVLARAEFVKRINDMSIKYEMPFSKGVSSNVIEQAKRFADTYTKQRLNEVAKIHFKTFNEIN